MTHLDIAIEKAREYVQSRRLYPTDPTIALGVGYLIASLELSESHFLTIDEIKHIYARGDISLDELAKMLGVSRARANRLIGPVRRPRHSEEIIQQVCELKSKRRPNKHIVNITGLTKQQVSDIIRRYYRK
jgi:hypothetical protein